MEQLIYDDLNAAHKRRVAQVPAYQVVADPKAATPGMNADGLPRGTVVVDDKHKQHVVAGASRAVLKTGATAATPTSLVLAHRMGIASIFSNDKAVIAFVESAVGVFRPSLRGQLVHPNLLAVVTKGFLPLLHEVSHSVPETVIASALGPTTDYLGATSGLKNYDRFAQSVFGLKDPLTVQFGELLAYWDQEMDYPEARPSLLEAYNVTVDAFNKDLICATERVMKGLGPLSSIAHQTEALQALQLSSLVVVFKSNVRDAVNRQRLVTTGVGMMVSLPSGNAGRGAAQPLRKVTFHDGGLLVAAAPGGGYDDDGGVAPPPTPPSGKRKRPALASARPQSQHQKLLKLHAATAKSNELVLKQLQSLSAGDPSALFGLAAKAAAGKDVSGAGRANGLRPQREHKPESAIPCSFFAAGKCTYGNKCKFVHGGTVAAANGT
jgi:hypothetical protein